MGRYDEDEDRKQKRSRVRGERHAASNEPGIKVLINGAYGGFRLPSAVLTEYKRRTGRLVDVYDFDPQLRTDTTLISVVEDMEEASPGCCGPIRVDKVPMEAADAWWIHEYDGAESIRINEQVIKIRREIRQVLNQGSDVSAEEKLSAVAALVGLPTGPGPVVIHS